MGLVKHWPADLAVPGLKASGGGNLFNCKQVPLHTAFNFHPSTILVNC